MRGRSDREEEWPAYNCERKGRSFRSAGGSVSGSLVSRNLGASWNLRESATRPRCRHQIELQRRYDLIKPHPRYVHGIYRGPTVECKTEHVYTLARFSNVHLTRNDFFDSATKAFVTRGSKVRCSVNENFSLDIRILPRFPVLLAGRRKFAFPRVRVSIFLFYILHCEM